MMRVPLSILALAIAGCAAMSTPPTASEFAEKFPKATKSKFYDRVRADGAVRDGSCKRIVRGRRYDAPMGMTAEDDMRNGAAGVDGWIRIDGGNAYTLENFEWRRVSGGAQLVVYFDTMLCE